jgi:uncharacterized membrane protein
MDTAYGVGKSTYLCESMTTEEINSLSVQKVEAGNVLSFSGYGRTRYLGFIATFTALNVVFRIGLQGGPPNMNPVPFLIIISGIVIGPVGGFIVGFLSMVIGDLFLGAGVWTIVDAFCMAIPCGLVAGVLWYRKEKLAAWRLAIVGFFLVAIFDISSSVIDASLFHYSWWLSILGLYFPFGIAGFSPWPFGFVDELTTAILLALLGPKLVARIRRLLYSNVGFVK